MFTVPIRMMSTILSDISCIFAEDHNPALIKMVLIPQDIRLATLTNDNGKCIMFEIASALRMLSIMADLQVSPMDRPRDEDVAFVSMALPATELSSFADNLYFNIKYGNSSAHEVKVFRAFPNGVGYELIIAKKDSELAEKLWSLVKDEFSQA